MNFHERNRNGAACDCPVCREENDLVERLKAGPFGEAEKAAMVALATNRDHDPSARPCRCPGCVLARLKTGVEPNQEEKEVLVGVALMSMKVIEDATAMLGKVRKAVGPEMLQEAGCDFYVGADNEEAAAYLAEAQAKRAGEKGEKGENVARINTAHVFRA